MHLDSTAANDPSRSTPKPPGGSIELDDQAGRIQIRDDRLFQTGRRAFAQRLVESLCAHPEVKNAAIDLGSSTCRVDFDHQSKGQDIMSRLFVEAVRAASEPSHAAKGLIPGPRWSSLAGYRTSHGVSIWETHVERQDRLRLVHQGGAGDAQSRARLARGVWDIEGVERYHVSPWSQWITVVQKTSDGATAIATLEKLLQGTGTVQRTRGESAPGVIVGWSRLGYLALAGGSLAMTVVAVAVPGIPTVPFLLATSYYLARSSPQLNKQLHRAVFIGPILEEWETHSALSMTSKRKLLALTAVTVFVSLVVAPLSPLTLFLILIMVSLTVQGILAMPSIEDNPAPDSTRARALPAV